MQAVNTLGAVSPVKSGSMHPTLQLLKKELTQGNVPFPQATGSLLPSSGKPASEAPKKKFKFFKTLALGAVGLLALKLLMNKFKAGNTEASTETHLESTQQASGVSLDVTA